MHLVIANKLYSSWSLRPWLVLKENGIAFEETVIPLRQPDTKELICKFSPTGLVPVLIDGDAVVWESIAIISYLADRFPEKPIWPKGGNDVLAHAKSIAVEMHSGFRTLRQVCPMNLGKRFKSPEMTDDLRTDIERLEFLLSDTRRRFGGEGGYLFGAFSGVDAMYAPVVTRLDTYQLPVSAETQSYMDTVLANPSFLEWKRQAFEEPWTIEDYEEGHVLEEDLRSR